MFTELPRYIGFPNQVYIEKEFSFKSFEKTFKNKVPFFVSTYQFKDKNTPIIDNMFFDIDSYFSIRIPYRNIKKLKDFCNDYKIPYIINFSGGKGFHFYMRFKPIIPKTEQEKNKIRDIIYSLQLRISKDIGIEAYDEPTYGRMRFLCRYPTSKYIRRDEETGEMMNNGFYCRNLTEKDFDKGLKHIVNIVKEPGDIPKTKPAKISLYDIKNIYKDLVMKHRENGISERMLVQRAGSTIPTISALGVPCLKAIANNKHPSHFERIELVSFLKFLGYTDVAINAFLKNLNWRDYKYAITSYQVRTINPRYPKCSFLRKTYGHLCKDCLFMRR